MSSSSDVPIDVFVGVDVGKTAHHAVGLGADGAVLVDRALPQDESALVELITALKQHGRVLFVVDQPATIGALPLAVARAEGVEVGYLPGLAMRRVADLHAGEAKTDARDAAIIAHTARAMLHALRALRRDDELTAPVLLPAGFGLLHTEGTLLPEADRIHSASIDAKATMISESGCLAAVRMHGAR